MNIGDLVERRGWTIRGPGGKIKQLEETPYYGIVTSLNPKLDESRQHPPENYVEVLWFGKDGSQQEKTVAQKTELVKISD